MTQAEVIPSATTERRLGVVGELAFEALVVVDDDRRYLTVNPAATRILGLPADEIIGRRLEDFSLRQHWSYLDRLWNQFRRQGELEGPYLVRQGDGTCQPIRYRAHWHYGPGEHLIAAIEAPVTLSDESALDARLTQRERQILALVAAGGSNEEIARELSLSPATVKTHLQNIYAKLGVRDRAASVAVALRSGLIN